MTYISHFTSSFTWLKVLQNGSNHAVCEHLMSRTLQLETYRKLIFEPTNSTRKGEHYEGAAEIRWHSCGLKILKFPREDSKSPNNKLTSAKSRTHNHLTISDPRDGFPPNKRLPAMPWSWYFPLIIHCFRCVISETNLKAKKLGICDFLPWQMAGNGETGSTAEW